MKSFIVGVIVVPDDVAADHVGLLAVAGVAGAVEGEIAQSRELRLNPVQPGAVRRRVGDLGVTGCRPLSDALVFLGFRWGEKLSQMIAVRMVGG